MMVCQCGQDQWLAVPSCAPLEVLQLGLVRMLVQRCALRARWQFGLRVYCGALLVLSAVAHALGVACAVF
jgi:hypothetical protein